MVFLEGKFPRLKGEYLSRTWRSSFHRITPMEILTASYEQVCFPDGSTDTDRTDYDWLRKKVPLLEAKLNKYSDLPLWIGYELPLSRKEREAILDLLLTAFYKQEDILEFENLRGQEKMLLKELTDKKPNTRAAIVREEAKRLRRDNPEIDKVKAKIQIDIILKQTHNMEPFKRTQFNRLIKDLRFPPGHRGKKSVDKKK